MMRWSCQRLHGCVPVPPRPICRSRATEWIWRATFLHRRRSFGEVLAAAGAHLDFGGDQLADDIRREVGLDRRRVELLEAVGELERLRIEERELLLHRDGEVGAAVEVLAGLRQQVLPRHLLLVAHGQEGIRQASSRCATLDHDQRSTTALRAARRSSSRSAGEQREQLFQLAREIGCVAGLERREMAEALGVLLLEPGGDLGETGVPRDERRRAGGGGFRSDHAERLGEDRRHDRHVGERQQVHEVAVLERSGEERAPRRHRFQRRAVRAEADDDEAHIEFAHRFEQDVHALLFDQLPEVDNGRLVAGQERCEPLGVAFVRQPLVARRSADRRVPRAASRPAPRPGPAT